MKTNHPPRYHSAGAVVATLKDDRYHYVLIEERSGHIGLPKGRVERGETLPQAALREVWEETALRVRLTTDAPLFTERYTLRSGGDKRVDYFIALYENQTPRADLREIRRVMLLPLDAALEALSHPSGRNILLTADSMLRQGDFVPSGRP